MVSGTTTAPCWAGVNICPDDGSADDAAGICRAPARLRFDTHLSGPSPTPCHGSSGDTTPQIQSCTVSDTPRMSACAELVDAITVPATPNRTVTVTTAAATPLRTQRAVTRAHRAGDDATAIPHTTGTTPGTSSGLGSGPPGSAVTTSPPDAGFLSSPQGGHRRRRRGRPALRPR